MLEQTLKFKGKTWDITGPALGFGITRVVVLTKPEMIQHMLKESFDKYEKGKQFHNIFTDFLGDGIFVSDGAKWKFHCIVASHMFSHNLLKEGAAIATKNGRLLVKAIKQASLANGGQGEAVDLQELFFCFTMDVFSEIAFGVELKSLTTRTKHPFAMAFDRVQKSVSDRMQNFFWSWERFAVQHVGK